MLYHPGRDVRARVDTNGVVQVNGTALVSVSAHCE